ncbi:MAG: polysaccharide biosynthesis/export family protein [Pseudomonadota bacterium]
MFRFARVLSVLLVVVGTTSLMACASVVPVHHVTTSDDVYRLDTGDIVEVRVFGQPDLSGEYIVDTAGAFRLPLGEDYKVRGITAKDVHALIVERLKGPFLKSPGVLVQVKEHRPFFIYGEVRNPGKYEYLPGMTARAAIAVAGGHTYRAKERFVYLHRQGSAKKQKVNLDDPIRPGDTLDIPERYF